MDDENSQERELFRKLDEETEELARSFNEATVRYEIAKAQAKAEATFALLRLTGRMHLSLRTHNQRSRLASGGLTTHEAPPSSWLLAALLPTKVSDDFIANMEELYSSNWLPKYGRRKARFIWVCQSARMIVRASLSPVLDLVERVKKITTG